MVRTKGLSVGRLCLFWHDLPSTEGTRHMGVQPLCDAGEAEDVVALGQLDGVVGVGRVRRVLLGGQCSELGLGLQVVCGGVCGRFYGREHNGRVQHVVAFKRTGVCTVFSGIMLVVMFTVLTVLTVSVVFDIRLVADGTLGVFFVFWDFTQLEWFQGLDGLLGGSPALVFGAQRQIQVVDHVGDQVAYSKAKIAVAVAVAVASTTVQRAAVQRICNGVAQGGKRVGVGRGGGVVGVSVGALVQQLVQGEGEDVCGGSVVGHGGWGGSLQKQTRCSSIVTCFFRTKSTKVAISILAISIFAFSHFSDHCYC